MFRVAETLKLKAAMCLMKEHHLGLLILTETKTTQYYSYDSEGYLIVLSGTNKDKHGGVGAIVAPWMRPALLDVLQVSSRIIQLSFKKRGGNFHVIGTYAPHSGLDFEEVRDPYWESLETQLEAIPQPEPVYITGDVNVRFQAKNRHDGDVLGPFVYGKGAPYIDHTATSNRSLCIKMLQRNNMVEVASYKTPKMIQQITYKDKAAPPTDWSQFVMDPLVLQQFYGVVASKCSGQATQLAFRIRSFLDLPPLLHPPKYSLKWILTDFKGSIIVLPESNGSPRYIPVPVITTCWSQRSRSSWLADQEPHSNQDRISIIAQRPLKRHFKNQSPQQCHSSQPLSTLTIPPLCTFMPMAPARREDVL